jgi:predicted nucleotidyltransferase
MFRGEKMIGIRTIDEKTITEAVELLQRAAPGATIIVFGSCARGEMNEDSDLDVLVVESEVTDRWDEMVRLREALRPLRIPVDVLVYSRKTFEDWVDTPGTTLYEAVQEGRIFHAKP